MTARVPFLANEPHVLYRSPDSQRVFASQPGILRLPSGRLVATMNIGGPGVRELPGPKAERGEGKYLWQGKVYTSDDGGESWVHRVDYPFFHARPFRAGNAVYVMGHAGDLTLIRSSDDGTTWSPPAALTQDEWWHQSTCSVARTRGRIFVVMEKLAGPPDRTKCETLAPVVMSADVDDDLRLRNSWTFSEARTYLDLAANVNLIGVPFIAGRGFSRGWLEANLVRFTDPAHPWFDPDDRTFYLWMRAANAAPNLACVARAVEDEQRRIRIDLPVSPAGSSLAYLPCPGGHLKFYILYDEPSRHYWLVSNQSTDSLRYPWERHRLALHFSVNCIDWQLAGIVSDSGRRDSARNYASMAVDGDDLIVASRSGSPESRNNHDSDMITLHRVHDFRSLVY